MISDKQQKVLPTQLSSACASFASLGVSCPASFTRYPPALVLPAILHLKTLCVDSRFLILDFEFGIFCFPTLPAFIISEAFTRIFISLPKQTAHTRTPTHTPLPQALTPLGPRLPLPRPFSLSLSHSLHPGQTVFDEHFLIYDKGLENWKMFKCGLLLFWDHLAVSLCVPVCVCLSNMRVCACVFVFA